MTVFEQTRPESVEQHGCRSQDEAGCPLSWKTSPTKEIRSSKERNADQGRPQPRPHAEPRQLASGSKPLSPVMLLPPPPPFQGPGQRSYGRGSSMDTPLPLGVVLTVTRKFGLEPAWVAPRDFSKGAAQGQSSRATGFPTEQGLGYQPVVFIPGTSTQRPFSLPAACPNPVHPSGLNSVTADSGNTSPRPRPPAVF